VFRLQFRIPNPGGDGSSGRLGQFKLHGPLGLLLHNHRSRQNLIAVGDVAHTEIYEIASTQLAVNREVEQCQISGLMRVLKLNPDGPDVLRLQRRLLPNQLAFVPGFPLLTDCMTDSFIVDRSRIVLLLCKGSFYVECRMRTVGQQRSHARSKTSRYSITI